MAKKLETPEGSTSFTVRISIGDVQRIDEWRRSFTDLPSRGVFLRQAIEEKLSRDDADILKNKKAEIPERSMPLSVRVSIGAIQRIDEWRQSFTNAPSRSDFLRQAIGEKLSREDADVMGERIERAETLQQTMFPSSIIRSLRDLGF